MKSPRLILALGLAFSALRATAMTTAAADPAKIVNSGISAVTVYTDRAVITRTTSAELGSGITELVFEKLPATLLDQSLQVSGKGTAAATILDVRAKQTYVDFTPNARVKELEDQLRGLQKQTRGLDDHAGLLHAQRATLDRMEAALTTPPTKDVPRPAVADLTSAMNFLVEQRTKITADLATLDEAREDLNNKINAAQAQLNELRGAGGRGFKTVTVRVSAAEAGSLEVSLSYTVPNASWMPSYDARVLSAEHAVALGYFGVVRQNTGEDWKDVMLTLSTARPSLGGAAPVLNVWNLDVFVPRPIMAYDERRDELRKKAERGMPMSSGAVNMQTLTSNAPEAAEFKDAEQAQAAVETGATSATFKIAAASSVPSDNTPQRIPISSAKLNANPEYLTVPKRLAAAFLTAKVVNGTDFPLLGGAMNVFLDGSFVATSALRTVMPGEKFDLALGADEGISVKYKRVSRFAEDTGLTNSGKRITYEYLLTIQNNKRTTERVIVADQVPLSRNEKITVKLLSPDAKDVKPTDEGTLKWTLDLKAGEKRELTVKFAVEYDKDVNVAGLEPEPMPAGPLTLLVDNGSLEPAATLALRKLAARLCARLGQKVEPVSLLHSSGIDPKLIGGSPAKLLFPAMEQRLAANRPEFTIIPLFFGPSKALTEYIPENIARLREKFPKLRVALAAPLQAAGDDRLAQILADHVIAKLAGEPARVALVDHGSPVAAVTAVRNELATQLAERLGARALGVAPCSMERRPESEYDFGTPLLADLLATPPWNSGRVIVAMQFLSPGRHAGSDGDVAKICRAAEAAHPGLKTQPTDLVGTHPLLLEILADRWRAAGPPA